MACATNRRDITNSRAQSIADGDSILRLVAESNAGAGSIDVVTTSASLASILILINGCHHAVP